MDKKKLHRERRKTALIACLLRMFENAFNSPSLALTNEQLWELPCCTTPGGPIFIYFSEVALDMVPKKEQWI